MSSSATSAESYLKTAVENGLGEKSTLFRQSQWSFLILGLFLNDAIMMGIAFRLAYLVRFEASLPFFRLNVTFTPNFYLYLELALLPAWLLIFAVVGLYRRKYLLGGTLEYAMVLRGTTIGLLLVIVAGFLEPNLLIARGWILPAWFFGFLFIAWGRFGLRRLVYYLRRRGYFLTPALLLGANVEARLLAEQLISWETSGLQLVGVLGEGLTPGELFTDELNALGGLEHLDQVIERLEVEDLILAKSALSQGQMLDIFKRYGVSKKVNLRMSSGLLEIITTGLQVKEIGYVPLVSVNKVRLTGPDRALKIMLDYGLTLPGLILFSPLLLLIAIAVKLDSPGPVLHRRGVMGLNGRRFDAYKFRTMFHNGDEILADHPELVTELARNHKLAEDPRVSRLGRFLRRTSLDELPQLINILKGEMSLVGPRMISPEEMPKYDQWGINLLTVRPGITGLWQVSGRSDISYQERVRLDMHYIRNWTIWLDLHLLFQTIPAVIKGRGAY